MVPVRGDRKVERDETFRLLVVPAAGTWCGDLVGRGTIRNDDSTNGGPSLVWRRRLSW